jgi:hypothetical protein
VSKEHDTLSMEVNDAIEEPKTLEQAVEHAPEHAPEAGPADAVATAEVPGPEAPSWIRLAYAIEFLLALIAVVLLWTEVGGQGHMDLLPWYSKLSCVLAFAWCCVRFTAGMVEQPQTWNRRTIGWLAGMLIIGVTMAGITFYYHLHEVPDETDTEDATSASLFVSPSANFFHSSL